MHHLCQAMTAGVSFGVLSSRAQNSADEWENKYRTSSAHLKKIAKENTTLKFEKEHLKNLVEVEASDKVSVLEEITRLRCQTESFARDLTASALREENLKKQAEKLKKKAFEERSDAEKERTSLQANLRAVKDEQAYLQARLIVLESEKTSATSALQVFEVQVTQLQEELGECLISVYDSLKGRIQKDHPNLDLSSYQPEDELAEE